MSSMSENKTSTDKRNWERFWAGRSNKANPLFVNLLSFVNDLTMVRQSVALAKKYSRKGTVIQAGSGEARNSLALSRERGDRVIALDFSPQALRLAGKKALQYQLPIWLLEGDMGRLPFNDQSIELVWNEGVMEHIVDPLPFLRDMKRVGKTVICIVPAQGWGWKLVKGIKKFLKADEGINEAYYKYHDRESMSELFEKAGFDHYEVKKIVIFGFINHVAGIGITDSKAGRAD
ncbi:MAG: class I SAM-dependent methyltransferase [bacterium]